MRKLNNVLFLIWAILFSFSSCQKWVEGINKNPNSLTGTSIEPEYVLPKTIVSVARFLPRASAHGEELVGYTVNPGAVSGFGEMFTYKWGPNDWAFFWGRYDNITDLNAVINAAAANKKYIILGAAAKVIKVMEMQFLVDMYNNVPFTEANKGIDNLTPAYDKGTDIYKTLSVLLDEAIAEFNQANANTLALNNVIDPLFKGNLVKWKQFANTLKLKLIIRAGDKVAFADKNFSADGFLGEDALVQPGFTLETDKLNPTWSRVYGISGSAVSGGLQQRVPSFYVLAFYNGTKLEDPFRGYLTYRHYPTPGVNMLGYDPGNNDAAKVKAPNDWYISLEATPSSKNYAAIGIFKGPSAAQPIFLAAESYFLQAEAVLKGLVVGNLKDLFEKGILASFTYLNKDEVGNLSGKFVHKETGALYQSKGTDPNVVAIDPAMEVDTYLELNKKSALANLDVALTDAQKLEAIITQKYIALNLLFGTEAWNEYRRTGYPSIEGNPVYDNRNKTFVSVKSESTAADKLPTRLQYPQSEFTFNAANVNAQKGSAGGGIDVFKDKIFWAK